MSDPRDIPRITINWDYARPRSWQGWVAAVALVAFGIAAFALVAVVASTLFVIALVVGAGAAASYFIGNLFRRRPVRRDIGPYRGD